MTLDEMIELLTEYRDDLGGDTEVRTMTQQNWPFENSIAGICSQQEMLEVDCEDNDEEDAEAEAIVYIVEGSQLCYGSKAAWDAARKY